MMTETRALAFIRARRAEELPPGRQRVCFHIWSIAALLLSSAAVCVVSLALAVGNYGVEQFLDYFTRPDVILLNYLPVLLLQTLLLCAFGRQWLAFLLGALAILTASVGNLYKLQLRYEPFVFSDFGALGAAMGVARNYDLTPNTRVLAAIALTLAGTLILLFFCRGRWKGRTRLLLALLILLSLWPLWRFVYSSSAVFYSNSSVNDNWDMPSDDEIFVRKGFVYPFLHSITASPALPPEGYSAAEAARLLGQYADGTLGEEQKVDLIVFQLESFKDIRGWGSIPGIQPEAYAIWDALREESVHGILAVNNFAGGTANTERGVLAAARDAIDPKADRPSYVWYLRSQGYRTFGNHNYFCWYYNRLNVNGYLGFEGYRFYEDHFQDVYGEPTPFENSDTLFFNEVLDEYQKRSAATEESLFSFNVTLQGHSPYGSDYLYYPSYLDRGDFSEEVYTSLSNYLGTVQNTQSCIERFTDAVREQERPVVLLIYGDHCPNIGDNAYLTGVLGVNMDTRSYEGFLNMFSTEYLIWANDAAREKLGRDLQGEGPTVSACYLMNVLFDQLGWQGPAFMQLSRETQAVLPVVNAHGYYVENGSYTTRLSEEGQRALRDFDCVTFYQNSIFGK